MNVGAICQRVPFTIRQSDDVISAAQLMRRKHIGYLVVVEPDAAAGFPRVIGVLTDRDIVITTVAPEVDARRVRVGDIMTTNPVTVAETDSIEEALKVMRRAGVRRAPVVDDRRQIIGILSLDDMLMALAGNTPDVVAAIRLERQIDGRLRS
jgi:CBS domain-containing protein